ncbi:cyclase family protein [Sorangium sp. So ce1335]|uniref:cyclase family protein n=1 Tax=Sorangium sp. So ce1335 TaxID=3133335 RepID=UPI003F622705
MTTSLSRRLVDLSHTVEHGMTTYRGVPAPVICDFLSREQSRAVYAEGVEFHIGRIDMVANTGTYVDSPFHRYAGGRDIADLRLESLADLESVVVEARDRPARAIDADAFAGLDLAGKAVLVRTGWSEHWRTDRYFEGHPFLTRDAARLLAGAGVAFVGVDTYNIDDTADPTRPVHSILLGADIPICEHMTALDELPAAGARLFAVPVKVRAFGTFPVRAFAIV